MQTNCTERERERENTALGKLTNEHQRARLLLHFCTRARFFPFRAADTLVAEVSPFRFRNRDEKKAAHEPRGSKRGRNGDFFPSYIKRLVSMRQQPGGVGEKQSADGVTQGQSRAAFLLRVTRRPHIARRGNWEPAPSVGSRAAGALIGHHGRARCFAPPRR